MSDPVSAGAFLGVTYGLIQILHVGNVCVGGPSLWFHMIKWFDITLSTIAFLIKHVVHMIPF